MAKLSKRSQLPKIKKLPASIMGAKTGRVFRYGVFLRGRKTPTLVAETKASAVNARKQFLKESIRNPRSKK